MTSLVLKVHRDYQQQIKLIYLTLNIFINKMSTSNTSASQIINQTSMPIGAHILPATSHLTYDIKIQFNDEVPKTNDKQLKHLIKQKIENKEFFYGIEILARNHHENLVLDYKSFGPLMPLFTSIVWLSSEYWSVPSVADVDSIKLAGKLQDHGCVLPHFSCYHLNETRLEEFLNLNFSNVLAIRGDYYDEQQTYKYSGDLVENIRKLRGDSITIAVGGYPEGHPECRSIEEDLNNLAKKVQVGADFIITQICFSPQAIIDFIKNCRAKEIKVPILVGIFVPDSLRTLETILRLTKIQMQPEILDEYRNHNLKGHKYFREYAVHKAVEMIEIVLSSDAEVYGLQFFTMNKFKNISKVLAEIQKNKNFIKKR